MYIFYFKWDSALSESRRCVGSYSGDNLESTSISNLKYVVHASKIPLVKHC